MNGKTDPFYPILLASLFLAAVYLLSYLAWLPFFVVACYAIAGVIPVGLVAFAARFRDA